jgi:hypothetical protein
LKTLLKLIVAAAIIHATWRAGMVYFRYYELKDDLHQIALFSGNRSEHELHVRALEAAKKHEVPLDPSRLRVRREENQTTIEASYDDRIELLPRYFYPWRFNVSVDAFSIVAK